MRRAQERFMTRISRFAALAAILVAACLNLCAQTEPGWEGNILDRFHYFHDQRAFPNKTIPAGARANAVMQLNSMRLQFAPNGAAAALAVPTWSPIGAQPINSFSFGLNSGRVSALAVDPTNSLIVYLGAADGGVWKTTDGGLHWTPLTDNQLSLSSGALAVDPNNPSVVYVATGENNFSGDEFTGHGILKSTNGGATWTNIGQQFIGAFMGAIAVSPANSNVLLVGVTNSATVSGGVYRSTNGGSTWTQVIQAPGGDNIIFDTTGSTVYAATAGFFSGSNTGVWKSTDGGATWQMVNGSGTTALPVGNAGRIAIGMSPGNTSVLYAAISDGGIFDPTFGQSLGIFKTTDGGATWKSLSSAPAVLCNNQCWYDLAVAVSPANVNVVYAGGAASGTVFQSTDGGTTWNNVTRGSNNADLHPDLHALAFDHTGSTLYVGNDGGVWSTSNPSATPSWTSLNATLGTAQYYPGMSIDPTNVNRGFGGTQDNSTEMFQGNPEWNTVTCGDGGFTAIDQKLPSTVYATCQQISILKSTSGGTLGTWSFAQTGINTSDPVLFIPPMIIDPTNPLRLYFGTSRVYQTTNGAGQWTAISPQFGSALSALAVAPSNGNMVYAGLSQSGVEVTTNAGSGTGAKWAFHSSGLPSRFVSQVAVDPRVATTAYLTVSGFGSGHVFRTTNGGVNWTNISGNLPDAPANDIVVDPSLPNTLYVATDVGVLQTTNGGGTWSPLGTGLPNSAVLSLKLHSASRTLRAGTHGRSAWQTHLPLDDLAIGMTETPNPVRHGANLTYTLKVTNGGPDTAVSVSVSDTVPKGTTFVGFKTTAGTCSAPRPGATGTLTCSIASLAKAATVTITMVVHDIAAAGTVLSNTATVQGALPDGNTKNNTANVKTKVF